MKTNVNLLPIELQQRFEIWRQAKRWAVMWLATAIALAACYALLERDYRNASRDLADASASSAYLREVAAGTHRLQTDVRQYREAVETGLQLEQSDVPLALLQVVTECVEQQGAIQLDSLRIDESAAHAAPGSSALVPRKHVLLAGSADSDVRVSALVSSLRATELFQHVELISSQAQSEEPAAKRAFQVRCEQ